MFVLAVRGIKVLRKPYDIAWYFPLRVWIPDVSVTVRTYACTRTTS